MEKIILKDYYDNYFSIIKKPKNMTDEDTWSVAQYVYNKYCNLYVETNETFTKVTQTLFTHFGFGPLDTSDYKYYYKFNNGSNFETESSQKPEVLKIEIDNQMDYIIIPDGMKKGEVIGILDIIRTQSETFGQLSILDVSRILSLYGFQRLTDSVAKLYVSDAEISKACPTREEIVSIYENIPNQIVPIEYHLDQIDKCVEKEKRSFDNKRKRLKIKSWIKNITRS